MDKDTLVSLRQELERQAATDNSIDTIAAVKKIAVAVGDDALADKADSMASLHFHMLRYITGSTATEGLLDEQQDFFSRLEQLVMLALRAVDTAVGTDSYAAMLRFLAMRHEESIESLFADYITEKDAIENDPAALTDVSRRKKIETIASDIFNRIWTSFYMSASELTTLETLLTDKRLYPYDRIMWLHGVGLSLLRIPDSGKTDILHRLYTGIDVTMAAIAMTWLMEIWLYEGSDMVDIGEIASRNAAEYMEFLSRSMDDPMERSRKLQSLMSSFSQSLKSSMDKAALDLDAIGKLGDENMSAIEEIEKARRRGDDVTLALVRGLDNFKFFRQASNWFLPFHADRSEFADIVDNEGIVYAQTLESNNGLCAIDKYANLSAIVNTPGPMRKAVIDSMVDFATNPAIDLQGQLEAMGSANPETFTSVMRSVLFIFNRIRAFNRGLFPAEEPDLANLAPALPQSTPYEEVVALAHKFENHGCDAPAFALMAALAASMPPEDDVPVEFVMDFARLAQNNGWEQMAINMLAAFDDSRKTAPMVVELSKLYLNTGRDHDALAVLENYAERFDGDPAFLAAIGSRRLANGQFDEALATFYQLNYVLPEEDLSARPYLMEALFLTGDYEGAVAEATPIADGMADTTLLAYHTAALWMAGQHAAALTPARRMRDALAEDFDETWTDFVDKLRETLPEPFPFLDAIPDMLRYADRGEFL